MNRRNILFAGLAVGACSLMPALPALAAPFSSQRIAVRVYGQGPDVVLIPGLAASRAVWNETVIALPGHRYHLVQVAGFAGWPAAGNAKGAIVRPVADEIARYIAEARLNKPAIVGHSMGGIVAMMIGAKHPARVGKLMVVDMLPRPAGLFGASSDGARGLADSLRDIAAAPGGRELVGTLIAMFGNDDDASVRSDPDVVARASHELALTDLTPELGRINVPLTVVYASPDPQTRNATDRAFASGYAAKKGAHLIRVDRSGHMIMDDQPAKFRAALGDFLRATSPAR